MYVRRYLHLPSLAVGGMILYIRHMIGVAFGKRVSLTLCHSQPIRAQPVYEQTTASLDLIFYVQYAQGCRREFPIGSWR